MAMRVPIESKKVFEVSILSFLIITALSWILNKISPDIPFLKTGWILFLFLGVILLVTLFNFGSNLTSLKIKDLIFMLLVLLIVTALYLILPSTLPSLFSTIGIDPSSSNSLRDFFVKNIGSVISTASTGI